ncbi:hypothetical protein BGZ54_000958, partial [Gamsiella multidivaricata]
DVYASAIARTKSERQEGRIGREHRKAVVAAGAIPTIAPSSSTVAIWIISCRKWFESGIFKVNTSIFYRSGTNISAVANDK